MTADLWLLCPVCAMPVNVVLEHPDPETPQVTRRRMTCGAHTWTDWGEPVRPLPNYRHVWVHAAYVNDMRHDGWEEVGTRLSADHIHMRKPII